MSVETFVHFVSAALKAQANATAAVSMAKYMRTSDAFYGVGSAPRKILLNEAKKKFELQDTKQLLERVRALWAQPHREERYMAVSYLRAMLPAHLHLSALPVAEQMIREGAWWDYVDEISSWVVGPLLRAYPAEVWPVIDKWNTDPFMWIRRSSIICQLSSGAATDSARLFRYCLACAHESEFFIRKAIGWALRQYARVQPAAVHAFVRQHAAVLSPLSKKEALKHLGGLDSLTRPAVAAVPAAKRVQRARKVAVDDDEEEELSSEAELTASETQTDSRVDESSTASRTVTGTKRTLRRSQRTPRKS